MKKKSTTEGLRKLNLLAALLHAAHAVALLIIAKPLYAPVVVSYIGANDTSKALQTATHHWFDVNLVWVIAGMLLFTALMRLASATRKRDMYEGDLKKSVNRARWVEWGLASSAGGFVIASLLGVVDATTFLLLIGLTVVWAGASYANEVRVAANKRFSKLHFWLVLKSGALIWLALGVQFAASYVLAPRMAPVYAFTIYGTGLLLAIAELRNGYLHSRKQFKAGEYLAVERNYILIMMILQTAITWQIYAGYLR